MKSINFHAIVITLIVIFSFACARQSQLPKEIPGNLEIRYDQTYARESKSLAKWAVISGNHLKYERVRCDGIMNKEIPDSEIIKIYKTFVEEKFDLIEKKETADDKELKEFQQISLKAGTISKVIKYGNNSKFSKKDEESLGSIRTDIATLLEDLVEPCRN